MTNRKSARRKGKIQLINGVDFYRKMRKSLGNKRNELAPEHIEEITRSYSEFADGKYSKVFENEDFGFRKITVERPVRLNFQASPERIALIADEAAFQHLARTQKKGERGQKEVEEGRTLQEAILGALSTMDPNAVYRDRKDFLRALKRTLGGAGVDVPASVQRAIVSALSERDETAEICMKNGEPEPDTALRDTENVPLKDDVQVYFEREVKPFVPDAWIDDSRMKVGYEIPVTRHFYQYTSLRSLEEIEAEIRTLEEEIAAVRAAIPIAHLVTKGIGTGSLVECGVSWIGEVPAHWEVVRTRFVARLESGHTPSRQHPEYWVPEECTIPWFTLADVWQLRGDRQEYLGDAAEKISPEGLANSSARVLPEGTVVLSRTASVGFSGIMPEPMATSQDFVNWVCGPRLRPEYLLFVFRAMRPEFRRLMMGSTHQTIYMPDVRNFKTPLPPLDEQDAIVGAVRRESAKFDGLVERLERYVERLAEYRQTLTSGAVTGSVDVRAPEFDAVGT